jgi:putative transcriptional regulator
VRVRLKADGRIVEVLADGSERAVTEAQAAPAARPAAPSSAEDSAGYARRVRAGTGLTQTEFASRIGVPVDTVRNWEQGKRAPRGPARALLKLIETSPDAAFAVLAGGRP